MPWKNGIMWQNGFWSWFGKDAWKRRAAVESGFAGFSGIEARRLGLAGRTEKRSQRLVGREWITRHI
jgi:transposase